MASTASLALSRLTLNPLRRDTQRDLADCQSMHRRLLSAFPDLSPSLQPAASAPAPASASASAQAQAREQFGLLYRVESGERLLEQTRSGSRVYVLVQSRYVPDWSRLPAGYLTSEPEVKSLAALYDHLQPGMTLAFRLHANPTRRIRRTNAQESVEWRGKRVNLHTTSDQLDWLRRKGEGAGFSVLTAQARSARESNDTADSADSADSAQHASRRLRSHQRDITVADPDAHDAQDAQDAHDERISERDETGITTAQERTHARTHGMTRTRGMAVGQRAGTGTLTFGAVRFEGRLRIIDVAAFRDALEQGIGSGKAYGFGLLSIAPVSLSQTTDDRGTMFA